MMEQEWGDAPAGREWMGWPVEVRPDDVLQSASVVIATTRYAWAGRDAAGETIVDFAGFAHPLSRLAPDAMSSSAARSRAMRARSGRRAPGPIRDLTRRMP